ncbi:hypothetical protein CERSUDRAFT_42664 [Gelatoporia subvermispora B]|uniref:Alpha/beta hydrolase fold-3 domain-containing protein n=1 Tax=Ceriporiopsis subvermispora (strain B) TaxID=914234 RepID=M2PWR2_CERS8|nr:hypothetical protein CERSUDRAFT_42664 [Gelatoporia subvermispora B]
MRLAPEHQFPTGLNDAYAGLKWAADNTSILSVDLAKGFIVGGASAGAQFTTVLTHRARDDPFFSARKPTGQVLQCPCLIHPEVVPEKYKSELLSMEQNAKAIGISKELVYEFYETYGAPPDDPECSPLLYTSHRNLPPAFIQVTGLDPVRDDALLYGRLLKESDVPTKIEVYPGVPHLFPFWFPTIGQAKKWEEDLEDGLRWLLHKNE